MFIDKNSIGISISRILEIYTVLLRYIGKKIYAGYLAAVSFLRYRKVMTELMTALYAYIPYFHIFLLINTAGYIFSISGKKSLSTSQDKHLLTISTKSLYKNFIDLDFHGQLEFYR